MNRLQRQMDFLLEIDKEKQITRQTYLHDGSRKENDAEHAWHLALMAVLLQEYTSEPVDVLKVVTMVLLHDIVEIDAGDTYAYDTAAQATRKDRESRAAKRIFGLLPADQQETLHSLFVEFEAGETPEARYARALDNLQPIMLNAASDGKAWEEHRVQLSQILRRNRNTSKGSVTLWQYALSQWIQPNLAAGRIQNDAQKEQY